VRVESERCFVLFVGLVGFLVLLILLALLFEDNVCPFVYLFVDFGSIL
jgi:hypothetical protein